MEAVLTEILITVYVATNGLRVASYLPQIVSVARDHAGAKVISITSWSFWTVSNATTALYAWAVVDDRLLSLMSAANTMCCAVVVAMVVVKRRRPALLRSSDRGAAGSIAA